MNLKRSDKIIAVIGVIVIIIAAVGIVAYSTLEEEEDEPKPTEKTFDITWIKKESMERKIDCYAGKTYAETITISDAPSGSVLTSVHFELNWEDDNTYGLLKNKGVDTLTAKISLEGDESQEETSEGSGNFSFYFSANDIPTRDTITAEDITEAEDIIESRYSGKDDASFDVEVMVTTGEKLRRPLKYLKDQGNSFEIIITYTYYVYESEELEDDDSKSTELNEDYSYGAIGEFYKNLCWGRGVI